MKKYFLGVIFTFLPFLIFPKLALATTYYVSTSGSNSNDGSQNSPFRTIKYVIEKRLSTNEPLLKPGDTVLINPGTYKISDEIGSISFSGGAVITTPTSGLENSPITVKSNGGTVILDGENKIPSDTAKDILALKIVGDYWIFDGLVIANYDEGIVMRGSHNIIQNTRIHDIFKRDDEVETSTVGIYISNNNDEKTGDDDGSNEIRNNEIYNVKNGEGIYINYTWNNKIIGNNIHDNWEGIEGKWHGSGHLISGNTVSNHGYFCISSATEGIIEKNYIYGNCGQFGGIYIRNNVTVRNNIVTYNSTGPGLVINSETDTYYEYLPQGFNNKIYNNSFVGNATGISFRYNTSSLCSIHNNELINNISAFNTKAQINSVNFCDNTNILDYNDWFGIGNQNPSDGPNTKHLDPLFLNGNNNILELAQNSPLIDSGNNLSSRGLTDDFRGLSRPQGSGYDIGAYEYSSSQPSVIPSATPSESPTSTPKPGDANGDRVVDEVDYYSYWLPNYNKSLQGANNGDFNNSGKVDGVDYVVWLNNFGF